MISTRLAALAPLGAALALTGCLSGGAGGDFSGGGAPSAGSPGDFGATPGGVKDLHLARELLAQGTVPPPEALLVEGMFSEHDLGIPGPACTDPLCLRAAAGGAPDLDGKPRGWLQIGMSSAIDPDVWQPPATTFVMTVDVSGSMGWRTGDSELPTPGQLSRALLHRFAERLRPEDRIAIVTFGSQVKVVLPPTGRDQATRLARAIDDLAEAGSTDMESGLRTAYRLGDEVSAPAGDGQVRVVLFTDTQPNVGATTPSAFEEMVADGAERGVETTVLALGLGIGPAVLQGMAHLRGANAFSILRNQEVAAFMAEEFPLFTTPIAYDLEMKVAAGRRLVLDHGYGFPAGPDTEPRLAVSSVFLSRRRGAVLVSLAGAKEDLAVLDADVSLRFTTPGGEVKSQTLHAVRDGADDARGQWFAQPATAEAAALALLVTAMHDAAVMYPTSQVAASQLLHRARDRFAADAQALGDASGDDLAVEVELIERMATLVDERAPQGTLYGR